jgi:2-polyprenyl-3-methyl-5-hydroxy-6-metoxy-1,4-benzoquinol methylase
MKAASETTVLRDLWTTSPEYRQLYQQPDEIEEIARLLEMPWATALLDVGCGNGAFVIAAARSNPACRVWAFDALDSAASECQAAASVAGLRADHFTVSRALAESIPVPDGAVDRILCRAVLHHLPDPPAAYREFARLLKPGGMLLLQAPCNYWQKEWGQVISDLQMLDDDSHRRQYHQPAEVIAALNAAGLLMRDARCWPFPRRNLKPAEVDFIKRRGADSRFELRQESDGTWSCRLYWLRVRATRI